MDMIGHETITNHGHPVGLNILAQQVKVDRTVSITIQDEASSVPTLRQMVWISAATTRANRPITRTQYQVATLVCCGLALQQ
jgi:hypothetical protein